MIKRAVLAGIAFGAVSVAWAAQPAQPPAAAAQPQQQQQPSQQRPARPSYGDRYSVLSQRNIFLKDRSRGGSGNGSSTNPSTSATTHPSRRSPEESLLLRGIVIEEGEVRAYFEDVVNSTMVRVAEGDKLARGHVTTIDLDVVEYEPTGTNGGKRTFVAIGNDLTGKTPDMPDPSIAAATTSPVMPTGVEGLNPNDPNLTPEQKMKLRRATELKK